MSADKSRKTAGNRTAKPRKRSTEVLKRRLLEAAREEFQEHGFRDARTSTIARKASTTETQLYRYFSSKGELFQESVFNPLDELFSDFVNRHMGTTEAEIDEWARKYDVSDIRRTFVREAQDFFGQNSRVILSLIFAHAFETSAPSGIAEIDSLEKYFAKAANLMSKFEETDLDTDHRVTARLVFVLILATELFKDWVFPKDLTTDDELHNALVKFIRQGLGGR